MRLTFYVHRVQAKDKGGETTVKRSFRILSTSTYTITVATR